MGENCPECQNDIYAPYTYCSSCGWEASGREERKANIKHEAEVKEKKLDRERALRKRKEKARRKRKEEEEEEEEEDDDDDDDFDLDDDREEDRRSGRRYRDDYASGVDYRHDQGAHYHRYDRGDYRGAGKQTEYAPGPDWKPEGPTKVPCRCGDVIIVQTARRPVRIQCKTCGARAVLKGPPKTRGDTRGRERSGRPQGPPPRERGGPSAGRPKPTKGKCASCGSLRLTFHDDGSGICPDCNRSFYWDKEAERGAMERPRGGGPQDRERRGARDREGGRDRGGVRDQRGEKDRRGVRDQRGEKDRRGVKDQRGEKDRRGDRDQRGEKDRRGDGGKSRDSGHKDEYHCKSCNNPLTYVKMYEKWYCEYCRRYL